jgi:hypothetical protein
LRSFLVIRRPLFDSEVVDVTSETLKIKALGDAVPDVRQVPQSAQSVKSYKDKTKQKALFGER